MTRQNKAVPKPAKSAQNKLLKCSVCGTELRDPSEWVRTKKKIYCAACYQSLLYPNRQRGSQEIID